MQSIGDGFVETLLHFDSASGIQCDLQKDAVVRTMDAEVFAVELQTGFRMFSDDLEAVILWDIQDVEHGLIDDLSDLNAILASFSLEKIDTNERHTYSFYLCLYERNLYRPALKRF